MTWTCSLQRIMTCWLLSLLCYWKSTVLLIVTVLNHSVYSWYNIWNIVSMFDSFFSFIHLFVNDKLLIAYNKSLVNSLMIFRFSMWTACFYLKLSHLITHDLLQLFSEICKSNLSRMLLSCMIRNIHTWLVYLWSLI